MADSRVPQSPRPSSLRTRQYAITGIILGLLFPLIATLLKVAEERLTLTLPNLIAVQQNEILLWIIDTAPFFLGTIAGLAGRRQDVLLQTNERLIEREREIVPIRLDLEQRVRERTRELENRNSQMTMAVRFSREMAGIQDPSMLLSKAAELIGERFDYSQVNIFLLDEQHEKAFLQASSSGAGRKLLEQGYFVAVGGTSLVGRAAEQNKTLRFSEAGSGLPSEDPESPQPRAEIAIPMVTRGKVSGVLDIWSAQAAAFSQGEAEILQLLADQIAAAMDNIRLLNESRAIVSELEMITSQQTRVAWRTYLQGRNIAYQFSPAGVKSVAANARLEDGNGMKIPLILRGQAIGSIVLRRHDIANWSSSERDLAEKIATQVSLALDNSRLLSETRQRAVQEQTVNEISTRLSRSLDIDALLRTAVRELGALPDVAEVSVFVGGTEEKQAGAEPGKGN